MNRLPLLGFLSLVLAFSSHAEDAAQSHEDFTADVTLKAHYAYLLSLPEGYAADPQKKWPLIMFLHGAGERGDNLELLKKHGPPKLIAAHSGDHAIYPDCREPFMEAMAAAIREGTYAHIDLLRPFIDSDKSGIAKLGAMLGVDYAKTWSCYKGGERHCGTCGTCVERREAFINAGVEDPTEYDNTGPLPSKPGT